MERKRVVTFALVIMFLASVFPKGSSSLGSIERYGTTGYGLPRLGEGICAEPREWIVDDDGAADFHSIQEAINAASTGDTVYVRNGTYYENVEVNKTVSLIGESKENTIVDGGGVAAVIYIENDNVLVTGFTVRNSGWGYYYYESSGISTDRASFCNITGNIASNIRYGISSWLGQNNSISRNTISNAEQGISFNGPQYSMVISNSIWNTSVAGIGLFVNSAYTSIVANAISNSSDTGIYSDNSPFALITGNTIVDNYVGIRLSQSHLNKIYHNSFINNAQQEVLSSSDSIWDNGYPSGGNQWSNYTGVDANEDGIGDSAQIIDSNNIDHYPLMNPWAQPWHDWSHYHNYTEVTRTLIYLNETYPDIVDVFSIGKSWENKEIYCIKLTNESNTHPKPELFFVGYHHARELISAELPLYFAVDAATNFGTNQTLTRMLNYSEIYVVPALNVDGFDAVKQNEWQRKNVHPFDEDNDTRLDEDPPSDMDGDAYVRALVLGTPWWADNSTIIGYEGNDTDADGTLDWVGGVDINRNYGYQWNATCTSGSPYSGAEDYRGPAPFSEPETQAIENLELQHNFTYALSIHSGSESVAYPWGYTKDPTPDDATFREVASNLSTLVGAPYGQGSQNYTLSGDWGDWTYANRSTYALTCEIYGNNSAWQSEAGPDPDTWWIWGVFQVFNPDPSQIEPVTQRWLPMFTYITDRAIAEAYDVATINTVTPKTVVMQGYSTYVSATVTNLGKFTESFNVAFYANATAVQTKGITLASRDSANVTFTWDTAGFVKGNYTISACAWPISGEKNMMNNNFTYGWVTVVMVGDITGTILFLPDGKCDGADIAVVAMCFGSYPGALPPLTWYSNCDVNNDGHCDGADIAIVAAQFGKADP
jgi:parallel beta-helix repeat protein